MNKLEDLVPPLELCKQIPEGKFADTALVWHIRLCSLEPAHVSQRFSPAICAVIYPAPTLQEIMEEIDNPATAALKLWLEIRKEAE